MISKQRATLAELLWASIEAEKQSAIEAEFARILDSRVELITERLDRLETRSFLELVDGRKRPSGRRLPRLSGFR